MDLRPSEITANRILQVMTIRWNDAHVSHYSFSLLRHACPCAECRGGHEHMRPEPDAAVFTLPEEDGPATHLSAVEAVGSYGLTIQWEDGHHYGIYNWHYLRRLCPCQECRPQG